MGPSSIVKIISCVLTLEIFMTFLQASLFFYAARPQNSIVLPIFSRVFDLPFVVKKNDVLSRSNFGELQVAVLLKIKVVKKKQKSI